MSNHKTLSLDEVCERIVNAKNPVIAIHRSPDGDAVGSAMALHLIFKALGKRADYICADRTPKRLEFISGGLEYSAGSDFSDCDIICLDIASPSQLGRLPDVIPEVRTPYMMIDHHAIGEVFADGYIRADACATGEIMFDIAERMTALGHIDGITAEMASALYAAISSDGGCFKFSNVSPYTHTVAARLIETGIDTAKINRLLFDSKSESVLRAEGLALSKMKTYLDGKVSLSCITRADRDAHGLLFEDLETVIDVVRSLRGVEVSVAIKEQDDGIYKASLRSNGADVASVCARFGGGGHVRAAGCSLAVANEDEAIKAIVEAITEVLKK